MTCMQCPVIKQCTAYKEATKSEYGTWGGQPSIKGKDHA